MCYAFPSTYPIISFQFSNDVFHFLFFLFFGVSWEDNFMVCCFVDVADDRMPWHIEQLYFMWFVLFLLTANILHNSAARIGESHACSLSRCVYDYSSILCAMPHTWILHKIHAWLHDVVLFFCFCCWPTWNVYQQFTSPYISIADHLNNYWLSEQVLFDLAFILHLNHHASETQ